MAKLKFVKDTPVGRINLQRMNVDDLKPADYNPREMTDEARKGLSNSIDMFGLVQPIIWNKHTGNVVGGHQRLYDIINKGAQETDVVVVDLPLSKEKAMNVALNNPHISGDYTDDLQILLKEIDQTDFNMLQFEKLALPETDQKDYSEELGDPEFQIVIKCQTELEQQEIYNRLNSLGIECRLLSV